MMAFHTGRAFSMFDNNFKDDFPHSQLLHQWISHVAENMIYEIATETTL
jgi:hypothetical protein